MSALRRIVEWWRGRHDTKSPWSEQSEHWPDAEYQKPGINPIVWGYVLVAAGSGIWSFSLGFMAGYLVGRG